MNKEWLIDQNDWEALGQAMRGSETWICAPRSLRINR